MLSYREGGERMPAVTGRLRKRTCDVDEINIVERGAQKVDEATGKGLFIGRDLPPS
ncbi:hypothetical protein QNA08_13325 [Chelatococcus sp. SYSU_G07232]|uniref:Uncharacterized protein n=2 Tax=Chelatococcus albus TaxID=3047466 RepID=A0ABT7AJR1_9HYPH|nr:hypothetical protein [Chelatococcus sp. SYSU_G07232]